VHSNKLQIRYESFTNGVDEVLYDSKLFFNLDNSVCDYNNDDGVCATLNCSCAVVYERDHAFGYLEIVDEKIQC
jgi:hypothetical protein